eukprot:scaffold24529_cov140-Isochrysis_galbana.AAC.8
MSARGGWRPRHLRCVADERLAAAATSAGGLGEQTELRPSAWIWADVNILDAMVLIGGTIGGTSHGRVRAIARSRPRGRGARICSLALAAQWSGLPRRVAIGQHWGHWAGRVSPVSGVGRRSRKHTHQRRAWAGIPDGRDSGQKGPNEPGGQLQR